MSASPTLAVVGAGAFGTALAIAAAAAGDGADGAGIAGRVLLLGRDRAQMDDMAAMRRNRRRLPDAAIPERVVPTADPTALGEAKIVLMAVPSQSLAPAARDLAPHLATGACIVSCAKGFEAGSGRLLSAVIAEAMPGHAVAILSGPGFAAEIAAGLPTALTLAAPALGQAETLAETLSRRSFRLYASDDPTGVQVGGALKNVLAIAAGVVEGAGLGESARAALVARGLAELSRFAVHRGGRAETVAGLSGLGDLVLTATSHQSRNLRYGLAIGQGRSPDALARAGTLVEGVFAARAAAALAEEAGIAMPITDAVSRIVTGRAGVEDCLHALMSRPLRTEGI